VGERHRGQDADELAGGGGQSRAAGRVSRGCWRSGGGDQAGEGAPPCGDALASEDAKAEGERLGACVQGGMTQLLVAGIQPGTGGGDLAGIRAGARFSSRVAR
jgi:hypothetical protein